MRHPRPKTLFIPVLGLLAAAAVLLAVVAVTTYVNLDRAGQQALRVLDAQSSALVSGLAAGLRTGGRHWIWEKDSLQSLVEEMSGGDVSFVVLLDDKGRVLAHSNPQLVGRVSLLARIWTNRLSQDEVRGWFTEKGDLFVAGRKIREDEQPRRSRMGMMGQGRGMMRQERVEQALNLWPKVILVGLGTKTYKDAKRRQFQHALVMAGLLFVLGSAAIYFIFVVQNYRTIDRTLRDLSTYTAGIVDHMPNGLITLDAAGQPVMINRTARRMFGWGDEAEKELAGQPLIGQMLGIFGDRLAEGNAILEEELELDAADGRTIPVAVSAAAVKGEAGGDGGGSIFLFHDLTRIKSLEEQVSRNERLAAVGRLAAGVAHEVRNPLSSMRGLARYLAKGMQPESREAEYLKVMVEEIDRLNRVITSLLDFARPRPTEPSPVDLNETALHTLNLIGDDARHHGVTVEKKLASEVPVVLADRDQAVQAMLNLLLNAVEAMEDGGQMTVRTFESNGFGVFTVEDTGPGFPPEDRERLADPFFTTKKKGTGLGLAQVSKIMEAHKGRLELGAGPEAGARVSLYFPLAENPTEERS